MPLCVHCGTLAVTPLVTAYSPMNIVCTPCPQCKRFADPYLEHDAIPLVLDLILVKPRAYRHLLFNTGVDRKGGPTRRSSPLATLARRFLCVALLDAYLRWFTLCSDSTPSAALANVHMQPFGKLTPAFASYLLVLGPTLLELLALQTTVLVLMAGWTALRRNIGPAARPSAPPSRAATPVPSLDAGSARPVASSFGDQQEPDHAGDGAEALLELHHVPYALLLAIASPLLLLTLNLLWSMAAKTEAPTPVQVGSPTLSFGPLAAAERWLQPHLDELTIEWAVRNLIGGVSAGVALTVLMPSSPVVTVLALTAGWYVQTLVHERIGLAACRPV